MVPGSGRDRLSGVPTARLTCRAICSALLGLIAPSATAEHAASPVRESTARRLAFTGSDAGDRQQRGGDRGSVAAHQPVDQLDVLGAELHREPVAKSRPSGARTRRARPSRWRS